MFVSSPQKFCSKCGVRMEMKLSSGEFVWECVHCKNTFPCKKSEEPYMKECDNADI